MQSLKQQLINAHQLFANTPIPAMPKEVLELRQLFAKEELPNMILLEEIISQNTTLAGEVIKISNEPQFLRPRISSVLNIRDALNVIGLKRLQNLVISVGYQIQTQKISFVEASDFSINVAKMAAEVSKSVINISEDEAYLAGLFHNAGTMLLADRFPNYQHIFLNGLGHPFQSTLLEAEQYQTSHTIAGILVAKKWGLSKLFNQAILLHHQKDLSKIENNKARTLIAVIQVASAIVIQGLFAVHSGEDIDLMLANGSEELMLEEHYLENLRSVLISEAV